MLRKTGKLTLRKEAIQLLTKEFHVVRGGNQVGVRVRLPTDDAMCSIDNVCTIDPP